MTCMTCMYEGVEGVDLEKPDNPSYIYLYLYNITTFSAFLKGVDLKTPIKPNIKYLGTQEGVKCTKIYKQF